MDPCLSETSTENEKFNTCLTQNDESLVESTEESTSSLTTRNETPSIDTRQQQDNNNSSNSTLLCALDIKDLKPEAAHGIPTLHEYDDLIHYDQVLAQWNQHIYQTRDFQTMGRYTHEQCVDEFEPHSSSAPDENQTATTNDRSTTVSQQNKQDKNEALPLTMLEEMARRNRVIRQIKARESFLQQTKDTWLQQKDSSVVRDTTTSHCTQPYSLDHHVSKTSCDYHAYPSVSSVSSSLKQHSLHENASHSSHVFRPNKAHVVSQENKAKIASMQFLNKTQSIVIVQLASKRVPPYCDTPHIRIVGTASNAQDAKRRIQEIRQRDPTQRDVTTFAVPAHSFTIMANCTSHLENADYDTAKSKWLVQRHVDKFNAQCQAFKHTVEQRKKGILVDTDVKNQQDGTPCTTVVSTTDEQTNHPQTLPFSETTAAPTVPTVPTVPNATVSHQKNSNEDTTASPTSITTTSSSTQTSVVSAVQYCQEPVSHEDDTTTPLSSIAKDAPIPYNDKQCQKTSHSTMKKKKSHYSFSPVAEQRGLKFACVIFIKDDTIQSNNKDTAPEHAFLFLQAFESVEDCELYMEHVAAPRIKEFDMYCIQMYEWVRFEDYEAHKDEIRDRYRDGELQTIMDQRIIQQNRVQSFYEYMQHKKNNTKIQQTLHS